MKLDRLARILWAAALLALPVTSFRYFPFLSSTTYVRPLALYPLALLLLILFIQLLRRQVPSPFPGALILLGLFIAAAIFSTMNGLLIDPIPLRGQTYIGRAARALVTLSVGLVFFLSAVWMNQDKQDFVFMARWMLAGLVLDLGWSGVQAITFYTPLLDKVTVTHWQLAFSMRELVRTNRISGLAYEPSWLAGQIATLYLPLLVAAVLTRTHLTRKKWLEPALLIVTVIVLLMTYSRSGLLISAGVSVMVFVLVGHGMIGRAWTWFISGFRGKVLDWFIRLALAGAILGIMVGAILFLNQRNYFNRLWNFNAETLSDYVVNISAGARGAYATGALAAFDEYPVFGVGLGASGFYIYDNLPDWSLTTVPEIARNLNPASRLYPNPKNMYVRLLAETGLVGFVLFLVFQLSVLGDVLDHFRKGEPYRFVAVVGLFAWLAIALHIFTQDSFATPNVWILPGMLVGVSRAGT